MARRRRTKDMARLHLLHEAHNHLSVMEACQRFGFRAGPSEGDRALLAVIEAELTPHELSFVRGLATEDVRGSIAEHLPPLPHGEEVGTTLVEKARVMWSTNGWELLPGDGEVAILEDRRKAKGNTC